MSATAATAPSSSPPDVRSWVTNHTLAHETMTRHGTVDDVFDDNELRLLRAFCANPSDKSKILAEHDMLDDDSHDVDDGVDEEKAGRSREPGRRAQEKGSLAGYCVARHGVEGKWVLSTEEIANLRAWFESGAAGI